MNSIRASRVVVIIGIMAAATFLYPAAAVAQGKCEVLKGTITAQAGAEGWAGPAYLSFGKDPTVYMTSLLDVNNGSKDHPTFKPDLSGNFAGYEILTFTFQDGSWFEMQGHFIGIAGSTPYAYAFSEEGKITAGTGAFSAATGNISIHGSFVIGGGLADPDACTPEMPCVWISEMHGTVCGRR